MIFLKGKTITLYEKTQNGVDDFNSPIYEDNEVEVENILIEPASNEAIANEYEIHGKHISYILHIPKSDNHNWKDVKVSFYGEIWKTYGDILIYDKDLTPLAWNKKVKVERYE